MPAWFAQRDSRISPLIPPVSTRRNFLSWSARFFIMGLWRLVAPRKDPAISEPG